MRLSKRWQVAIGLLILLVFSWWLTTDTAAEMGALAAVY